MNESGDRRALDLKGLRYLEAHAASDIATMAELWDQASADADLERILSEIDNGLYLELAPVTARAAEYVAAPRFRSGQWAVACCAAGLLAAIVLLSMSHSPARHDVGLVTTSATPSTDWTPRIASGAHDTNAMSFSWPLHTTLSVASSLDAIE